MSDRGAVRAAHATAGQSAWWRVLLALLLNAMPLVGGSALALERHCVERALLETRNCHAAFGGGSDGAEVGSIAPAGLPRLLVAGGGAVWGLGYWLVAAPGWIRRGALLGGGIVFNLLAQVAISALVGGWAGAVAGYEGPGWAREPSLRLLLRLWSGAAATLGVVDAIVGATTMAHVWRLRRRRAGEGAVGAA